MSMKHIAIYRARLTGNDIEEEKEVLENRKKRSNENLFRQTPYEMYLWKKSNNRLKGEY